MKFHFAKQAKSKVVPANQLPTHVVQRMVLKLAVSAGVSESVARDCLMGNFALGNKTHARDVNRAMHSMGARKLGGMALVRR